jgi:hypothetical protein
VVDDDFLQLEFEHSPETGEISIASTIMSMVLHTAQAKLDLYPSTGYPVKIDVWSKKNVLSECPDISCQWAITFPWTSRSRMRSTTMKFTGRSVCAEMIEVGERI